MQHLYVILSALFQLGIYYDGGDHFDPYKEGHKNVRISSCMAKFDFVLRDCYVTMTPLEVDTAVEVCEMLGGQVPAFSPGAADEILGYFPENSITFRQEQGTQPSICDQHCASNVSDFQDLVTRTTASRDDCACPLDILNRHNVICKMKPGIPCSNLGVESDLNPNISKFKREVFNVSSHIFMMPHVGWRFGDFACIWRISQNRSKGERANNLLLRIAIVVDSKTRRRLPPNHCFGTLIIRDAKTGDIIFNLTCIQDKSQVVERIGLIGGLYRIDDIQNRAQTYTVITNTTEVLVQYAVRHDGNGTLGLHINTTAQNPTDMTNLPTRYAATEEGLSQDFTWGMAQTFCRNKSLNGSLCRVQEICRFGSWLYFERTQDDLVKPTRFIPLGNSMNRWAEYSSYSPCSFAPIMMDPRIPPSWGDTQGNCPNGNCNIKKYFYCCDYDKPIKMPPVRPVMISQDSLEIYYQVYTYKFIPRGFSRYVPHIIKKRPTYHNWNIFERLPGDVRWFQLQDGYSEEFPTPVYICRRLFYSNRLQMGDEVYKVALSCKAPWFDLYQFYTSLESREGTTALYVGASQSADILRTRVSVGSYCCGYDDPEHSFIMYGVASIAESQPPKDGAGQAVIREPRGTISSPVYADVAAANTNDLFIFIVVEEGKGIKLTPKGVIDVGGSTSADRQCLAAIELQNPVSHRVYAVYCGKLEGPHDVIYSDSNVLQIRLMSAEGYNNSNANFNFEYEEVDFTIPRPKLIYNNVATWEASRDRCLSNDLQLCRKSEICAGNIHKSYFGNEGNRGSIVPVLDRHLGVVHIQRSRCDYIHVDESDKSLAYVTFCCNYTVPYYLANWPLATKPQQEWIVIRQLRFRNFEKMGFGFVENLEDMGVAVKWRNLTITNKTANHGLVSSFTLSKTHSDVFNQTVYICHTADLKMRIFLYYCPRPLVKIYRGYAAVNNTKDGSLTKIYVGLSSRRSSRVTLKEPCCGFTGIPFELYVTKAVELK